MNSKEYNRLELDDLKRDYLDEDELARLDDAEWMKVQELWLECNFDKYQDRS